MNTQENIDLTLIDNRNQTKFEFALENGKKGIINYKMLGNKIKILKTFVPEDLRENGYGSAMVENTLSYLSDKKTKLIPLCSFVADYIEANPKWKHLVYHADGERSE